jgi:hypothetical protein
MKGHLGLRPKCRICGDDVFASPSRCCLAASLYGLNVTRSLSVVAISLKKSFTGILKIELTENPRNSVALLP